jgi:hypothetical protein
MSTKLSHSIRARVITLYDFDGLERAEKMSSKREASRWGTYDWCIVSLNVYSFKYLPMLPSTNLALTDVMTIQDILALRALLGSMVRHSDRWWSLASRGEEMGHIGVFEISWNGVYNKFVIRAVSL